MADETAIDMACAILVFAVIAALIVFLWGTEPERMTLGIVGALLLERIYHSIARHE